MQGRRHERTLQCSHLLLELKDLQVAAVDGLCQEAVKGGAAGDGGGCGLGGSAGFGELLM